MEAKVKKTSSSHKKATTQENTTTGLLRYTKTTTAALTLLEKSIELIYKKEFKKAHKELSTLCQSFPDETEILARARSYIQICEREEGAQKKSETTSDQLYALGTMEHNNKHYDEAINYFKQSLKAHPDSDYIYYSIAASMALMGNLSESLENLRKAVEINQDSCIYARNDEDFSVFQENQEFAELVGITANSGDE